MNLLLRMVGGGLILLAGYGAGLGIFLHHRERWRQLHTFARLLIYLQGILRYQSLTGSELLRRAMIYPDFSGMGLERCMGLTDLPLPTALSPPQQEEVRDALHQMAMQPREEACITLKRLASLCETAAKQACQDAEAARVLWPRLGLCAGALTVILLW